MLVRIKISFTLKKKVDSHVQRSNPRSNCKGLRGTNTKEKKSKNMGQAATHWQRCSFDKFNQHATNSFAVPRPSKFCCSYLGKHVFQFLISYGLHLGQESLSKTKEICFSCQKSRRVNFCSFKTLFLYLYNGLTSLILKYILMVLLQVVISERMNHQHKGSSRGFKDKSWSNWGNDSPLCTSELE